jgi:hypothetical protein
MRMKTKLLLGLTLVASVVVFIGCGYYGMFQPHTYNWGTGMPFLCDETNAYTFRQANQRWPTNYAEFARFMKQSTSCAPFDRVDFITKPDGSLEYVSYCFSSGITNRMTVKAPDKP